MKWNGFLCWNFSHLLLVSLCSHLGCTFNCFSVPFVHLKFCALMKQSLKTQSSIWFDADAHDYFFTYYEIQPHVFIILWSPSPHTLLSSHDSIFDADSGEFSFFVPWKRRKIFQVVFFFFSWFHNPFNSNEIFIFSFFFFCCDD